MMSTDVARFSFLIVGCMKATGEEDISKYFVPYVESGECADVGHMVKCVGEVNTNLGG